jgi:hypothetical protein
MRVERTTSPRLISSEGKPPAMPIMSKREGWRSSIRSRAASCASPLPCSTCLKTATVYCWHFRLQQPSRRTRGVGPGRFPCYVERHLERLGIHHREWLECQYLLAAVFSQSACTLPLFSDPFGYERKSSVPEQAGVKAHLLPPLSCVQLGYTPTLCQIPREIMSE